MFGNDVGNDMPRDPIDAGDNSGGGGERLSGIGSGITKFPATVDDDGETLSLIEGNPLLGLYFLDLASCLPQPTTLMIPKSAQYPNNAGRVHLFFPSKIQ